MPHLTSGMLVMDSSIYPVLTLKSWSGRVFVTFLLACVSELEQQTRGLAVAQPERRGERLEIELADSALQCLCIWFNKSETSPRLLTSTQAEEIAGAGEQFLRLYESLARLTASPLVGRARWKLIPKHHAPWQHIIGATTFNFERLRI